MSKQTIEVTGPETLRGQTNANARVLAGGSLVTRGQVNGDITVDSGGVLEQHGQVNGNIDCSGSATLTGMISGQVRAHEGSDVRIAEGVMLPGMNPPVFVAPDGTLRPLPTTGSFSTTVGDRFWRLQPDGTLSSV